MSRRRLVLSIALLVILTIAAWVYWGMQRAREKEQLRALEREVTGLIEEAVSGVGPPGMSAAFALPDGRIGVAVAGVADSESDRAMTPDTRFLAGSLGKSFVAALALALHREGTLDLDAPISRWLGDEPWFHRLPNGPDLTLRNLLQHQSGLVDHIHSFEFLTETLKKRIADGEDARMTPLELVEVALDREPEFPAGKGFDYGDTNYVVAGLVMHRASGRPVFDQIEERFLEPLDLDAVVVARGRRVPGLAAGYLLPVNPFLLPPKLTDDGVLEVDPRVESTAGGMAMAPRGAVHWAKALLEGHAMPGDYRDDLMERNVPTDDGRRYGLGVFAYDTELGEAWGHGGFFPGYRSEMRYFPESRIALAVQTNRDFLVDPEAVLMDAAKTITRRLRASE